MKQDIAVIGMYGKMPQSDTPEQYWKHLMAGDDLITVIPEDRFSWEEYFGDPLREVHKTNSKWGGFLPDVWGFDPALFKVTKAEADFMDPQQRLMLQVVYRLFEDSGYRPSDFEGSATGVFIGVSNVDYVDYLKSKTKEHVADYHLMGNNIPMVSERISYTFDLKGPCESVDTLCSSANTAICRAVEAIRGGNCDQAVAGGVNIILSPSMYLVYAGSRMLSPDGRCKTFDESADGFVRGEGAGALLLKPLERARKDRDHIYGVIKGAAVRHQGRSKSIVSPIMQEQAGVIADAAKSAGILPEDISYIETHGTGTALGDVVELNGLKEAFLRLNGGKKPDRRKTCALGAVKTNAGHLESAAGIAAVMKVLLAFRYGKIPRNLHCRNINPLLQLKDSPFYLVDEPVEWNGDRLVAGVSSFGAGGVNTHLLFEKFDNEYVKVKPEQEHIFLLSADTEKLLLETVKELIMYLDETDEPFENIIYTLQVAREEKAFRIGWITHTCAELKRQLNDFLYGKTDRMQFHLADRHMGSRPVDAGLFMEQGRGHEIIERFLKGEHMVWKNLYQGERFTRAGIPGSLMNQQSCKISGGDN